MSWINVNDRLPEESRSYLCLGERGRIFVGCYTSGHQIEYEPDEYEEPQPDEFEIAKEKFYLAPGWWEEEEQIRSSFDYNWFKRKVTHWQPLPERP